MNGKYLLDTNIVIALFANEPNVIEKIERVEEVYVPSIVLGELFYGAIKSANKSLNLSKIRQFASTVTILPCQSETVLENNVR